MERSAIRVSNGQLSAPDFAPSALILAGLLPTGPAMTKSSRRMSPRGGIDPDFAPLHPGHWLTYWQNHEAVHV